MEFPQWLAEHPARVDRSAVLDDSMPELDDRFAAAGIPPSRAKPSVHDYQRREGLRADILAAELDTAERRRRYIGEFHDHRMWCPSDGFDDDIAFLTEPYGDADRVRVSFAQRTATGPAGRFGGWPVLARMTLTRFFYG